MYLSKLLYKYPLPKIILLVFALVLIAVGAVPGYLTGKWAWLSPPAVSNLKQLKELKNTGLNIPGWETTAMESLSLGNHKWLRQDIQKPDGTQASLLLFNQNSSNNQPQVEWMDLNGYLQWKTDSVSWIDFKVERQDIDSASGGKSVSTKVEPLQSAETSEVAEVKVAFFRGWTGQQTYGVVQWYAWPNGGHPAPSRWFWSDRIAQLQGKRIPWVAVSIIIPMEPLGDLERLRPVAESLGKQVQVALMSSSFTKMKDKR